MRTLFRTTLFAAAALAMPVALSTASAAPAASAPTVSAADIALFRDLEKRLWDAWSKGLKSKDAAPFYSKKPGTLHFDISPLKFTGWTEYEVEAQKALPAEGGSAKVEIADDFQVMKPSPKLAIVMFTWKATFFRPDGTARGPASAGRETDVWELEADGQWRITHQHLSVVPRGPGAMSPSK